MNISQSKPKIKSTIINPIQAKPHQIHNHPPQPMNNSTNTQTNSAVTIAIFNTQGLITTNKNKCEFIRDNIVNKNNFILCITEIWLQGEYPAEVTHTFDKHQVYRADRDCTLAATGIDSEKTGRGVVP